MRAHVNGEGRLLEVEARGGKTHERGVFVFCPSSRNWHDIGECLRCGDYQGMWFSKEGACSLRCTHSTPRA